MALVFRSWFKEIAMLDLRTLFDDPEAFLRLYHEAYLSQKELWEVLGWLLLVLDLAEKQFTDSGAVAGAAADLIEEAGASEAAEELREASGIPPWLPDLRRRIIETYHGVSSPKEATERMALATVAWQRGDAGSFAESLRSIRTSGRWFPPLQLVT